MKYIDLFAGAGGFSEGFIRAGFEPIAHIENDVAACFTLKTRLAYHYLIKNNKIDFYNQYLKGEITRDQLYSLIPDNALNSVINQTIGQEDNKNIFHAIDELKGEKSIDIIVGGPPCQAYSLVGRARDKNGMSGDPRNYLYVQYGRFLKRYKPKAFVFENVIGLLSAQNGSHFSNLNKYFKRIGYEIQACEVNAKEFGVLQNRRRLIVVGWQKGMDFSLDLSCDNLTYAYKVKAVFEDLPKLKAGEGKDKCSLYTQPLNEYLRSSKIRQETEILTQHVARPHTEKDREIYRIAVEQWQTCGKRLDYNDLPERLKTHNNRNAFTDRFKVVADDLPYSQTVVAHIAKDGHYYIHPEIQQNRSITVREAARLQSFPDNYYFEGLKEGHNRTSAFRQIGNAVPPLMMEKIAEKILEYLMK
ncbi:MAG TPA: DNA cytosine methyltransferase [Syntrophorhabdaceae bacterium]|nr:DNA cytosine methyltransferase [Syntrophorhabdaceae bacterium]